jgi:hypothetical protein
MTCDEFLDRYSDFVDDEGVSPEDRLRFEGHVATCRPCARYHAVLARGTAVLREEAGAPRFRDDFRERLQHRIYLSEFESRQRRFGAFAGSGRGWVGAGLAAASLLLVLGAWQAISGALALTRTHALPPIVATAPPRILVPADAGWGARVGRPVGDRVPTVRVPAELWIESHDMLYEHSALYQRHRQGTMVRAGIQ